MQNKNNLYKIPNKKNNLTYVSYHLYTLWRIKCFPVAGWGCGSPRAGAEVGWCFASQHSFRQPGQSKHHLFGASGG